MGKSGLDDIFKKTETESGEPDFSDLDRGNIQSTGVGLRQGEIDALDTIGAALGGYLDTRPVARNALIRLAARQFIEDFMTGKITPADLLSKFQAEDKPKAKLDL